MFGQLLSAHAVPFLLKVLEDSSESDMVRHEAAEALGGIATPEVLPHLREWAKREDSPRVVKESCMVAIDMWEVSISMPCNKVAHHWPSSGSTRTPASFNMRTAWAMSVPSKP